MCYDERLKRRVSAVAIKWCFIQCTMQRAFLLYFVIFYLFDILCSFVPWLSLYSRKHDERGIATLPPLSDFFKSCIRMYASVTKQCVCA